jgi:hypothetical protein
MIYCKKVEVNLIEVLNFFKKENNNLLKIVISIYFSNPIYNSCICDNVLKILLANFFQGETQTKIKNCEVINNVIQLKVIDYRGENVEEKTLNLNFKEVK